jgi:hypothetical protein
VFLSRAGFLPYHEILGRFENAWHGQTLSSLFFLIINDKENSL